MEKEEIMAAGQDDDLIQRVLDLLGCHDHAAFLRRLAGWHESLGFGTMATRSEKVSRWKRGVRPSRSTEMALAALLGVPFVEIQASGWPGWVRAVVDGDQLVVSAPWTAQGALDVLDILGRPEIMDRRSALVGGGAVAATTLACWSQAVPVASVTLEGRSRVTERGAALLEARLDALRRLDDEIGSAETYSLARAECGSIVTVLRTRSHSDAVGRQLLSAAAEACRISGWCAIDSGRVATAERHYLGAARAAGSAQNPVVASSLFGFWSMARYSLGDISGALAYAEESLSGARRSGSPRLTAMAHARASRAHAKAGDVRSSRRCEDASFAAYERHEPPGGEPSCTYWIDRSELHSWAASNAVDLKDPGRALDHYRAMVQSGPPEPDGAYPRSRSLRLAREAGAHLELRNVDQAAHTAVRAMEALDGITSARSTTILTGLRERLRPYGKVPAVRAFLSSPV